MDTLSGEQLAGVHLSLNKAIYLVVHDADMTNVIESEHVSDSLSPQPAVRANAEATTSQVSDGTGTEFRIFA